MNLRVLVVEPAPEEALFLKEAFSEIEERPHSGPWIHLEALYTSTWQDAESILGTEAIDIVLLNPDLEDSQGLDTLRRSQAIAPAVPVILLLDLGGEELGVRLVRESAQDFLIRKHIDCGPLAQAIRNAVERNRLIVAADTARFRDPLTGLLNQVCFEVFAERDRKLAEDLGANWMLMLLDLRNQEELLEAYGTQSFDLALIETAEALRGTLNAADLLYRIGRNRFAITVFETGRETLEQMVDRMKRGSPADGLRLGTAVFCPENPASLEDLLAEASSQFPPRAMHRAAGTL